MKSPKDTPASLLNATSCAGAADVRDVAEDVVWRAGQGADAAENTPPPKKDDNHVRYQW